MDLWKLSTWCPPLALFVLEEAGMASGRTSDRGWDHGQGSAPLAPPLPSCSSKMQAGGSTSSPASKPLLLRLCPCKALQTLLLSLLCTPGARAAPAAHLLGCDHSWMSSAPPGATKPHQAAPNPFVCQARDGRGWFGDFENPWGKAEPGGSCLEAADAKTPPPAVPSLGTPSLVSCWKLPAQSPCPTDGGSGVQRARHGHPLALTLGREPHPCSAWLISRAPLPGPWQQGRIP